DYKTTTVFLACRDDIFSKILSDLQLPVTLLPLTAPFNGKFFGTLVSWLRYLMPLRPDKIILAEGGFRNFQFSTSPAAFVVARGQFSVMQLHPPPERTRQNSRTRLALISKAELRDRL